MSTVKENWVLLSELFFSFKLKTFFSYKVLIRRRKKKDIKKLRIRGKNLIHLDLEIDDISCQQIVKNFSKLIKKKGKRTQKFLSFGNMKLMISAIIFMKMKLEWYDLSNPTLQNWNLWTFFSMIKTSNCIKEEATYLTRHQLLWLVSKTKNSLTA